MGNYYSRFGEDKDNLTIIIVEKTMKIKLRERLHNLTPNENIFLSGKENIQSINLENDLN